MKEKWTVEFEMKVNYDGYPEHNIYTNFPEATVIDVSPNGICENDHGKMTSKLKWKLIKRQKL